MSWIRKYLGGAIGVGMGGGAVLAASLATAPPTRNPSPKELAQLGKALFYDKTLSNPPGLACASCHSADTGYTYPNSKINAGSGLALGAVTGRFGHRKPPSIAYATYLPTGLPHFDVKAQAFVGGLFWDGRVQSALDQAIVPLTDADEMNNCTNGKPRVDLVVRKIRSGPTANLFRQIFGVRAFDLKPSEVFKLAAKAIVAFEASPEVSPFTSKYDAYLQDKAVLTPQELLGMRLTTGTLNGRADGLPFKKSAHCMDCHGAVGDLGFDRMVWSNGCYANLGVPRNPNNPRLGADAGLGAFLYPRLGLPLSFFAFADPFRINGTFKAPTLRNVDKRPSPQFVKCYMHNGYFKSLKDVVHFYNTRNLTSARGEAIDFTNPNPYKGLKGKPIWPRPEFPSFSSLVNPGGIAASRMPGAVKMSADPDAMQIGDLKLSDKQEDAIVAFLKALTDGYIKK